MKKSLEVDIPRDSEADVVNQHSLHKGIFTRTRIAAMSWLLILSLGVVGGTLAFIQWATDQNPNRDTMGNVEVEIVEVNTDKDGNETTLDTENFTTTDGVSEGGVNNKVVKVKSDDDANRVDEVVRVQFLPEIESNDVSGGHIAISEYWDQGVQQDVATNKFYVETSALKLWIADDWESNWVYNDGTFYYKKVLPKNTTTPTLLTGVTLQNTINKNDYKSIKVKVIAEAMLTNPKEALDDWGVTVTDNSDGKTKDVAIKTDDAETM